jgi:hypothetical protein
MVSFWEIFQDIKSCVYKGAAVVRIGTLHFTEQLEIGFSQSSPGRFSFKLAGPKKEKLYQSSTTITAIYPVHHVRRIKWETGYS